MATAGRLEGGREDKTLFRSIEWDMAREKGLERTGGPANKQTDWSFSNRLPWNRTVLGIWSTG